MYRLLEAEMVDNLGDKRDERFRTENSLEQVLPGVGHDGLRVGEGTREVADRPRDGQEDQPGSDGSSRPEVT